jgi:hypothetical protein
VDGEVDGAVVSTCQVVALRHLQEHGGRGCYRVQLTRDEVRADAHRFDERAGSTAGHEGVKRAL